MKRLITVALLSLFALTLSAQNVQLKFPESLSDDVRTILTQRFSQMLSSGGMTVADACINIRSAFPQTPHRDTILSFVENSGRGIIKCPVK